MGVQKLAYFGGSYSWEELYYDSDGAIFYVEQYHSGSVDTDEFYDGRTDINKFDALKKMIQGNRLDLILRFYTELEAERLLDAVLSCMSEQHSWLQTSELCGDTHCDYYQLTEREYGIFFVNTYFSVHDGRQATFDPFVVKKIIQQSASVTHIWYDWSKKDWAYAPLC